MRIVTCVKPVRSELISLSDAGEDSLTLNPYDNFALQDIIRAKNELYENKEKCEITCVAMGTLSSKEVLTKCIAYGADRAVLLSDKRFSGADTVATTYVMYKFFEITEMPLLIVCGQKSVDGETGQVVYGIAKRLGIPCIVNVNRIISITDEYVVVSVSDADKYQKIKVKLPAIIAYNEFTIHQPSVSLLKLKQARRKEIDILGLDDINADENKCGISGSRTKVINIVSNITAKAEKQVFVEVDDEIETILNLIGKYSMEGKNDE